MCDPATMLAVAGGIQFGGGVMQGRAARKEGDFRGEQADYQAALEEDRGFAEAAVIRRQGEQARSTAVAEIGASGTAVGEWSGLEVERAYVEATERDAHLAILDGQRNARQLRAQGRYERAAGRNRQRAAYLSGAGGALETAGWGKRRS